MDIVSATSRKMQNMYPREFEVTTQLWQGALEALIAICFVRWAELQSLSPKSRLTLIESWINSTKPRKEKGLHTKTSGNSAIYPCFELLFPHMPSYLRRAVINKATGHLSSHFSRLAIWEAARLEVVTTVTDKKRQRKKLNKLGREPKLQAKTFDCPVFYSGNKEKALVVAFGKTTARKAAERRVNKKRELAGKIPPKPEKVEKVVEADKAYVTADAESLKIAGKKTDSGSMLGWRDSDYCVIKLFNGKCWRWYPISLKPLSDREKERHATKDGWKELAPTLVKRNNRWQLMVPYEKKQSLVEVTTESLIVSVDIGRRKFACASVMRSDGTVIARRFFHPANDIDRMEHLCNEAYRGYRETGTVVKDSGQCSRIWDKVSNYSDEVARKTVHGIIEFALEFKADCIVMENLDDYRVPKDSWGARKARRKLVFFMRGKIRKGLEALAHRNGLRFSRVLARGTSMHAFDGTGLVVRAPGNTGVAHMPKESRFKTYDAELAASYNIGARYWIRFLKAIHPEAFVEVPQATAAPEKKTSKRKTVPQNELSAPGMCTAKATPSAIPKNRSGRPQRGSKAYTLSVQRDTVSGVPVARHRQVLASLVSLQVWLRRRDAGTTKDRTEVSAGLLQNLKAVSI